MKYLKYITLLLSLSCYGQKYDYTWIIGLRSGEPPDSSAKISGPTQFEFSADTVNYFRRYRPIDMSSSSLAASDINGQLRFYTDLLQINDTTDNAMPNGTGLNPGKHADVDISMYTSYFTYKDAIFLPQPGSDSLYYLFDGTYCPTNSLPEGGVDSYFIYTLIDLSARQGLGKVTSKNNRLIADYLMVGGGLSACKHANGRDWWILVPKLFTNCYYQYLLTPAGLDSLGLQCVGDSFATNTDRGQSCFSPDGSRFIWCTPYDSLHIMDFDRCTGQLSSIVPRIAVYDSLSVAIQIPYFDGVAVSPNSRFLYVSTGTDLWQYDLFADTIASSRILIKNLWQTPPLSSTETMQLGPDGKIYINPVGQDTFFHVINTPDSPGLACNFKVNGLLAPTFHWECMPIYPNYRLGPLIGSECDTIGKIDTPLVNQTIKAKESILKIFPNPCSDYTFIDYGFTDWSKGPVSLEICNDIGQCIYKQGLPMYSGFQKIDVSQYASGVYNAYIKRNNSMVATAKFVKE